MLVKNLTALINIVIITRGSVRDFNKAAPKDTTPVPNTLNLSVKDAVLLPLSVKFEACSSIRSLAIDKSSDISPNPNFSANPDIPFNTPPAIPVALLMFFCLLKVSFKALFKSS